MKSFPRALHSTPLLRPFPTWLRGQASRNAIDARPTICVTDFTKEIKIQQYRAREPVCKFPSSQARGPHNVRFSPRSTIPHSLCSSLTSINFQLSQCFDAQFRASTCAFQFAPLEFFPREIQTPSPIVNSPDSRSPTLDSRLSKRASPVYHVLPITCIQ